VVQREQSSRGPLSFLCLRCKDRIERAQVIIVEFYSLDRHPSAFRYPVGSNGEVIAQSHVLIAPSEESGTKAEPSTLLEVASTQVQEHESLKFRGI